MTAPEGFNAPPPALPLYVSWHGDLVVTFQNVDPATVDNPEPTPVDFPAGAKVFLDVATKPPQRFEAVLDGANGEVRAESEQADGFRDDTTWVLLLQEPGDPTQETPIVNGWIERADGKKP